MTDKQFSTGETIFAFLFAAIVFVFWLVFTGIINTDVQPSAVGVLCMTLATAIAALWIAAKYSAWALKIIHKLPTWVWPAAFAFFVAITFLTSVG